MKALLLTVVAVIALMAGIGTIHWQTEADTLRGRAIREAGVILDQVQYRREDKLANLTQGWVNPGAERRRRMVELDAKSEDARGQPHGRWHWR